MRLRDLRETGHWRWPPGPPIPDSQLHLLLRETSTLKIVALIYMFEIVFVSPVVEELLYRGFLYPPFARKFGANGAVWFSSLLWALGHSLDAMTVFVSVVGLVYGYVYRRTGSLVPSITFHISANTLATLAEVFADFERSSALVLPFTLVSLILFTSLA